MTTQPDNRLDEGRDVASSMLDDQTARAVSGTAETTGFGRELADLALEAVYNRLWTRPGLSARDRSLVTVSMLIALRAADELRLHFPAALRNGVTQEELEEVVYQSSGYAGFPAAHHAFGIARAVLPAATPTEQEATA
ncbi:carboxymuconolactone decarboxylase family protein [Streptomyces sp. NPDC050704]|uniref:carboxymuconolactone decarboxylase family protein n=1 Tax=Streptomyces sp. NPDC050704 TaxID=3157219 RepID=UPI00341A65C9